MQNILKAQIVELEKNILDFYQTVKDQHRQAIEILQTGNFSKLNKIINLERTIDLKYIHLLKSTFYNLAQYSFFGSHLRKVLSYSYIANELERIGDHGEEVCQIVLKGSCSDQQIKLLVTFWQKLFFQFEKVEMLFQGKDDKTLLDFLQSSKRQKVDSQSLIRELAATTKGDLKTFTERILSFFTKFHALDRSFARLDNIVEYLLLIRSFSEFWKYRKQSLSV